MEVFALLMIENNYKKWKAMITYTFKEGNKPMFNFHAKHSDEAKRKEIPGYEYIYLDQHPEFQTKWTKANSGQSKLQGISMEGLNKFINYRERCTKGREHARCLPVECHVLDAVCNASGVVTWILSNLSKVSHTGFDPCQSHVATA